MEYLVRFVKDKNIIRKQIGIQKEAHLNAIETAIKQYLDGFDDIQKDGHETAYI